MSSPACLLLSFSFHEFAFIESYKKEKKKRKKEKETLEESRPVENEAVNPLKRDSNMSKIPVWLINSVMVLKQAACRPHPG